MKLVTKHVHITILGLLIGMGLVGCDKKVQEGAETAAHDHDGHDHDHAAEEAEMQEVASSDSKLLVSYFALKDALVATDVEAATAAAKELAENSDNIIKSSAEAVASVSDVEAQRIAFESVSKEVYKYVKAQGSNIDVYKQYCPMAFNNTGAFWLSDKEEVLNPYFGDKMLKCGKVEEVIASK
ncbi:DUF3347 domain-containing protein [Flammeovirgaceae bacterium SG7u.111]|nr:DUF3347 domain-containing protein [Flammeovirgaceae bacterium SG7u.132]WPO38335.1 DUF3347 domain-containing protein [Flammeovirgaceae bacterium SG7u.111]